MSFEQFSKPQFGHVDGKEKAFAYRNTFVLQATLLSSVQSPFVVHYLESGKSRRKDIYWFVTELLNGSPLDEILKSEGPIPEKEAIKVPLLF